MIKINLLIVVVFSLIFISLSCSISSQNSEISVVAQTNNVNQTIRVTPTPTALTKSKPKIVSRQEWKAKEAIGEMKKHTPKFITVHHTASPQKAGTSIEKKMQNLQNFSQSESRLDTGKIKPAWSDIPYHYYIAVDGKIAEARNVNYVGDTNTDYDPSGHILVVLEGNFENEQPTIEQIKSLEEMISWLSAEWKIPVTEVKAHNDYASTACPGKNLKDLLPKIREKINKK